MIEQHTKSTWLPDVLFDVAGPIEWTDMSDAGQVRRERSKRWFREAMELIRRSKWSVEKGDLPHARQELDYLILRLGELEYEWKALAAGDPAGDRVALAVGALIKRARAQALSSDPEVIRDTQRELRRDFEELCTPGSGEPDKNPDNKS